MSDAPCKEFSDAISKILAHLILRDMEKPQITGTLKQFLNNVMALNDKSKGVTLRLGNPDSSSRIMSLVGHEHYECHIYVTFPFKLTPIRDDMRSGCVMLQASADVQHPTIVKGFLDRKALSNWFLDIMLMNFPDWSFLQFNTNFTVEHEKDDIKVTFLPVLEFEHSQWPLTSPWLTANGWSLQAHPWYAVALATRPLDSRSFVVWVPDWERYLLDSHQLSRRLLSLFNALAQNYEVYIKNFDLVIRTIMLQEVHNLPRDLGNSMIAFLEAVVARFQEGTVNRFLSESINVLQCEEDSVLEHSHESLNAALKDLKRFKIIAQTAAEEDNWSDKEYDYCEEFWMTKFSDIFI